MNTEYYAKRLEAIMPQIAKLLSEGNHVEIAPSRSGVKMYINDRKHVALKGMKNFEGGSINDR